MKSQIKLVLATVLVFLTLTSFASNIQDVKEKSLTHIIICWLDKSVKSNDIEVIINETKKLNSIPGVSGFSVGKSIKSNRDIVDDSFTFAVSMKFKNMKEMNTYLKSKMHVNYVKNVLKSKAVKIIAYDFENETSN